MALPLVAGAGVEIGLITGARPFTVLADVVVSIALATVVCIAAMQGSTRGPEVFSRRPPPARGLAGQTEWPWWTVLALLAAWELLSFLGSPRPDHPTLSYLSDLITVHPAGRALVFAGWLALGGYLVSA